MTWETLATSAVTLIVGVLVALSARRQHRTTKTVADRTAYMEETDRVINTLREEIKRLSARVEELSGEVKGLRAEVRAKDETIDTQAREIRVLRARERDASERLAAAVEWMRHAWHTATDPHRRRPLPHEVHDLIIEKKED